MYTYKYPRPAVTADIVLLDLEHANVLLIRRGHEPFKGCWAFPGGFFDMSDADIEHTAARELEEETGLTDIKLRQVCVASRQGRDPRGRTISVVFLASVDPHAVSPKAGDDAAETLWFPINNLPSLAFDHSEILKKVLAS